MNWQIEPFGDILRLKFDTMKTGESRSIFLMSDPHTDHPKCKTETLLSHLDMAKAKGSPVFIIGDIFCLMNGRNDPRRSYAGVRPEVIADDAVVENALDYVEAIYRPYADNLALLTIGNHETAVIKNLGFNLVRRLVSRLRDSGSGVCYGGYGGYVRLAFSISTTGMGFNYRWFHGSGGGGAVTKGVIQNHRRATWMHAADIIHTGHVHEAHVHYDRKEDINQYGTFTVKKLTHIVTPTYKEEYGKGKGGWHVERGAPPKPIGCAEVVFTAKSSQEVDYTVVHHIE